MDEIKNIQPPTVQKLMLENDRLINDCLCNADHLYRVITADSGISEGSQKEVGCVLQDLTNQNEKLNLLLNILERINLNVFEGGN